jgi:hypothetical protein
MSHVPGADNGNVFDIVDVHGIVPFFIAGFRGLPHASGDQDSGFTVQGCG